jgi:hypothetical protein
VAPARDPGSDFRVVADSCSTHTLGPGAACTVMVEFAPAFRSTSAQLEDQLLFWGDGTAYDAIDLRGAYDRGSPTGGGPPLAPALEFLVVGGLVLFYLVVGGIVAIAAIVGIVLVVNAARRARN